MHENIFNLLFLSLGPLLAFCQDTTEFNFTGQVMSHDSVPLENAYLINYRTYNVYATNQVWESNHSSATG